MISSRRGFTLIEVLLAIMVGSLLLTTIYGIFGAVSNSRNRLESQGEAYHQVRIFYDRIGSELRSLRIVPINKQATFGSGQTFEGDTYLEFNTEMLSPLLQQRGGLSRVRYEFRQDGETLTIYRSEQVLLADLAPSAALPFVSGVKEVQIRFFQQGEWFERWTSSSPPRIIEIALELEIAGQLIPFRSSFVLPEASG